MMEIGIKVKIIILLNFFEKQCYGYELIKNSNFKKNKYVHVVKEECVISKKKNYEYTNILCHSHKK